MLFKINRSHWNRWYICLFPPSGILTQLLYVGPVCQKRIQPMGLLQKMDEALFGFEPFVLHRSLLSIQLGHIAPDFEFQFDMSWDFNHQPSIWFCRHGSSCWHNIHVSTSEFFHPAWFVYMAVFFGQQILLIVRLFLFPGQVLVYCLRLSRFLSMTSSITLIIGSGLRKGFTIQSNYLLAQFWYVVFWTNSGRSYFLFEVLVNKVCLRRAICIRPGKVCSLAGLRLPQGKAMLPRRRTPINHLWVNQSTCRMCEGCLIRSPMLPVPSADIQHMGTTACDCGDKIFQDLFRDLQLVIPCISLPSLVTSTLSKVR